MKIKLSTNITRLKISAKKKVFNLFLGNFKSHFKGQGIELEDLRIYTPGDNIKDIDWNSTAKTGQVFVKKYVETRELNLMFLVDGSSSLNLGSDPNYLKKDIIYNSIYLLTLACLSSKDRFVQIITSKNKNQYSKSGRGKIHMIRILNDFEKFFKNNIFNSNNLQTLLTISALYKKRSVVFLFTDNFGFDEKILKLLKAVNKKHEIFLIFVKDSFEDQIIFENSQVQDIENGKIYDNFDLLINKQNFINNRDNQKSQSLKFLNKNGISYLILDEKSDIIKEFFKLFKKNQYAVRRYL